MSTTEDTLDDALTALAQDMLSDWAERFYEATDSGDISFDPGRPGSGIPSVLSALYGRRRDRVTARNDGGVVSRRSGPSLYDDAPEVASVCALRSVLWVARFAPDHPIRLTPSRAGMLHASYLLPGEVEITNLLLFDRLSATDDLTVTAASLVEAIEGMVASPGNAITGPGCALDESRLEHRAGDVPTPQPPPENSPAYSIFEVPLEVMADHWHRLLPPAAPEESAGDCVVVPAFTRSGMRRDHRVPAATLRAFGWLDPFAVNYMLDQDESLFLGVSKHHYYWWGFKTMARTPRPA